VREERYRGRSSKGAYEKLPGEEQQMRGAFSVECPECGAPPGFACRKPKGKSSYDSHKARRERAYGEALAQALGASYPLEHPGPGT
jgi:ribosomal protein L34E